MASFFDSSHYRPLLREEAARRKREQAGWTLGRIATKARIQAPYFTNVLKEKAHLSADQLYAVADALGWGNDEREFALLLLEWERSGNPRRREALLGRLEQIRKERLETKGNFDKPVLEATPEELTKFFLNPFYTLINAFIGLPRFAKGPRRIARCLGLDPAQAEGWLKDLVDLRFVARRPKGYEKLKKNFLLPKDSPLFSAHVQLMQQAAARQLARLPDDKKFTFSATLSADPATREKIHREFLKFGKAVEALVKEAPPEELYGLRFDLFQWSHEGAEGGRATP